MVNNPNSVPPNNGSGNGQGANGPQPPAEPKSKNTGQYQFNEPHKFLGMTFTAKDWNKLMNIFLNNLSSYINTTFQKMTEKMKKDWARGAGEDPDD